MVWLGVMFLALSQALPAQPPPEVCLTNACGPELRLPALREAVEAGDPLKVLELGGSADEAMDAARRRQDRLRRPEQPRNTAFGFDRFADASDGSTYVLRPPADISTPPGVTVVRSIERRYPDGRTELMHLLSNGAALNAVGPPRP